MGYQLHLKSQDVLLSYLLGQISEQRYRQFSKVIYMKDPLNPWYEFMYLGPTDRWLSRALSVCPTNRLTQSEWVIWHSRNSDWAWQRSSQEKAWEIANGHDCVFLLNMAIAHFKGDLELPFSSESSKDVCEGKNKYLGDYNNKNICEASLKITEVKCARKNGIVYNLEGKDWCLLNKGDHYKARFIKAVCPKGHEEHGEYNELPICRKKRNNKIRLFKCNAGEGNKVLALGSNRHKYCLINKNTYFQELEIGKFCPITNPKFEEEFIWDLYPICRASKKIKREDCTGRYKRPREKYCLVQDNGFFKKQGYKGDCPFGTNYAGEEYQDKSLCRPVPYSKITKSRCSNKSGIQWNGWCLWDKGEHFKARELK